MNIQEFLNKNKIIGMIKEVAISDRICDEKGIPLKFKIKTITSEEYEELRSKNTKLNAITGDVEVKTNDFYIDVIAKSCVEPNFKDKTNLDAVGAVTPAEYINSVLLAGEIDLLAKKIGDINGYKPFNVLVEEAKKLIEGGDWEAVFLHCALQKLHKFPHEILALSKEEKAFVFASCELKAETDKKLAE